GGGVHTFSNFDNRRNHVQSVSEAFRHSVNLVFVRMMRDIARYYMYIDPDRVDRIMTVSDDPERIALLRIFADQEGRVFQEKFIRKYMANEDPLDELVRGRQLTARRLAVAYRAIAPEHDFEEFSAFLRVHATRDDLSERVLESLYERHGPGSFNLSDQGYLARIHPLELWTARYLRENPLANYQQIMDASVAERQEVYRWLFRTTRKHQQDRRLRIMLEEETFQQIHASWARLGYPFETLVPSYASSIGSSADRPAALAELVGILVNDGIRLPNLRVESYEFALDTPFETRLHRPVHGGEEVLPREVARIAREALLDVVEKGTARRIHKSFVTHDGVALPIGGKTGTGDNRHKSFVNGRLVESKAQNRTATFVFFVGDRFFGTLTAFVPGKEADDFSFTSGLTVQLLKGLGPALMPLFDPTADEPIPLEPEGLEEVPDGDDGVMETAETEVGLFASTEGLPAWEEVFRNDLVEQNLAHLEPVSWYERAAEDMPHRVLPTWTELMDVEGTPLPAWTEIIDEDDELLVAVEAPPRRRLRPKVFDQLEEKLIDDVPDELLLAELDLQSETELGDLRDLGEGFGKLLGLSFEKLPGTLEEESIEELLACLKSEESDFDVILAVEPGEEDFSDLEELAASDPIVAENIIPSPAVTIAEPAAGVGAKPAAGYGAPRPSATARPHPSPAAIALPQPDPLTRPSGYNPIQHPASRF
ncbi:MAG: hypothetical protein ACNA8W_12245, partial [Bradymonadaceae bacterium]